MGEEALHTKSFSTVWAYSKWLENVRAIVVILILSRRSAGAMESLSVVGGWSSLSKVLL